MPNVTLCTYTFNDAPLTHCLLRSIAEWSRRPDEIVLVDDGSTIPFSLDDAYERSLPLRLIRFPENKGFTEAKRTGLSSASGEIIISMDCDARLSATYLERCLVRLEQPEVGMVSGSRVDDSGTDSVSRYLTLFGQNYLPEKDGFVDFIPGHAFAMRRAVWEETGGFGGHSAKTAEDHALCAAVLKAGYKLLIDSGIRVRQVRCLSRHAHCRRLWVWLSPALFGTFRPERAVVEQLSLLLAEPMLDRATIISGRRDFTLLYIEVLYLLYIVLMLCRKLTGQGAFSAGEDARFWRQARDLLHSHPRLLNLLKADLLHMKALSPSALSANSSAEAGEGIDWREFLECLNGFSNSGLFSWLDREGVPILLREESELEPDFSAYTLME